VRAGEVREPERLSGFICSIARHIVIEHFRKSSRREKYYAAGCGDTPSPGPSPLDRLLKAEKALLARQVLAELPSERDRDVLYRFYIAEEDREKICADLGIEAAHLSQILCRARQRYKALFSELANNQAPPMSRIAAPRHLPPGDSSGAHLHPAARSGWPLPARPTVTGGSYRF